MSVFVHDQGIKSVHAGRGGKKIAKFCPCPLMEVVDHLGPQLPGAQRTRKWHHHGSDTPTYPRAILLHKSLLGAIEL